MWGMSFCLLDRVCVCNVVAACVTCEALAGFLVLQEECAVRLWWATNPLRLGMALCRWGRGLERNVRHSCALAALCWWCSRFALDAPQRSACERGLFLPRFAG